MPVKDWKQYRKKHLRRRRAYERKYQRARRRGAFTCKTCGTYKKSVRVRVCDCTRHLLMRFR